ncbi:hypothetical protein HY522_05325 [bacterium]|nr:hypothetical protein [bacterium]
MTTLGLCLALGIAPALSDTSSVEISLQTKPPTIFLNFTQTDIGAVLQALAKLANVNIVPDRDVTGPVDIHIKDVPLDDALEILCTTNGYTYSLVTCHTERLAERVTGARHREICDPIDCVVQFKNEDQKRSL